jgi:rhamnopyranosyl-N-acetylglucosaminyl-diphospho-decaprenol beta-1,3/1,4-galactofuranosyltransferase
MATPSVASVTVAFNDARVLPRQMEALLGQTRPLQEIIVVDNSSTDGTVTLLAKRYPQITVLRMSENAGVGGAAAAGLRYAALERHHDWVLTLDADSEPHSETLQILLDGVQSLGSTESEVGMLAPLAVHTESGTYYPPLFWRDGYVKPPPELLHQSVWFADLVMGSGCMVRREVVEKVGVPRADFFMYFLDYEYCLRARSHGYKIAIIAQARLAHEVGKARKVRLPGYSGLWPDHAPWHEYYMSRNIAYTAWWLYPNRRTKQFVLKHLVRHAGGALLFGSNKLACLRKMAQGFVDGRRGKLGIRFLPDSPVPAAPSL